MKKIFGFVIIVTLSLSSSANAIYVCEGTFLKDMDPYPKGYKQEVNGYTLQDGEKMFGVLRAGYFPAKYIKLNKSCDPNKLAKE